MTHIRVKKGASVYETLSQAILAGHFPQGARLLIIGPETPHPSAPDMLGTITVRPREAFAVVAGPIAMNTCLTHGIPYPRQEACPYCVAAYEQGDEPDGCYYCGDRLHHTNDCNNRED